MYARVFKCHREDTSLTALVFVCSACFLHSGGPTPSVVRSLESRRLVPWSPAPHNHHHHTLHALRLLRGVYLTLHPRFPHHLGIVPVLPRTWLRIRITSRFSRHSRVPTRPHTPVGSANSLNGLGGIRGTCFINEPGLYGPMTLGRVTMDHGCRFFAELNLPSRHLG